MMLIYVCVREREIWVYWLLASTLSHASMFGRRRQSQHGNHQDEGRQEDQETDLLVIVRRVLLHLRYRK